MFNKLLKNHRTALSITACLLAVGLIAALALYISQPRRYSINLAEPTSADEFSGSNLLILNTDKDQYLPGESAEVSIVSLNSGGKQLCNDSLDLSYVEPTGEKTEISAVKSATCGQNSSDPSFTASFQPASLGEHTINLKNPGSGALVSKKIMVIESSALTIKRSGAANAAAGDTGRYPMIISLTAAADMTVTVTEKVPADLEIVWYGNAKVADGQLMWTVDLKAGEAAQLPYEYSLPSAGSANSYKLGLLEVNNSSGKVIYSEKGPWQLAVIRGTQEK